MTFLLLSTSILAVLIMVWCQYLYAPVLHYLTRNKKPPTVNDADELPRITLIVPVYNEEDLIEKKLENVLSLDYPKEKMKIIVSDNSSDDRTVERAGKYPVQIIKAPRGKVLAINRALEENDAEVVVLTDVDVIMKPDAVKKLVCSLKGKVGAVTGFARLEYSKLPWMKSKLKFYYKDWQIRIDEGLLDTVCSLDGRLMAFRTCALERYPEGAIVDDFDLTFLVREKGYRCIVEPDAIGYEPCPTNFKSELRQIRRRAALGIKAAWHYKNQLFNPRYSYFGMFIFPTRRFLAFFLPFLMIFLLTSLGLLISWFFTILLSILGLLYLLCFENYTLMQIAGIILGWYDVIAGRVLPGGVWKR